MDGKEIVISIDLEKTLGSVEENLAFLLEIFDEYRIKTTFFVTEDIIDEDEGLLREIADKGHEIAYHGFHIPYFQRNIHSMSVDDISSELCRAKQKLLDKNIKAKGFRAEGLRINRDILNEVAKHYVYDSSLCKPGENNSSVYMLDNGLTEVSLARFLNLMKFYPMFLIHFYPRVLVEFIKLQPSPGVLYFHIFDFDRIASERFKEISWHKQMLYYRWLSPKIRVKFRAMLNLLKSQSYSFVRIEDLIRDKSGN